MHKEIKNLTQETKLTIESDSIGTEAYVSISQKSNGFSFVFNMTPNQARELSYNLLLLARDAEEKAEKEES